jgi:mannose-6-phosphate isomerase-like protein (cupin superfamily)
MALTLRGGERSTSSRKKSRDMGKSSPIDVHASFENLAFLGNRTPESHGSAPETFASRLSDYRNGGIFVSSWGGSGEWERHPNGDEIVMVIEGEARVFLVQDGEETDQRLREGQLIVIPENTWHRLESARVKILTVTPRPTDHQAEFPR